MPHIPEHPSAYKRQRQNLKRAEHNRAARSKVRTAVKIATEAIAGADSAAQQRLREAISALDKAASKGMMHRNTASRKIGRLSAQLHRASAQKAAQ
jgi:small subunit ribosomal protein S20